MPHFDINYIISK